MTALIPHLAQVDAPVRAHALRELPSRVPRRLMGRRCAMVPRHAGRRGRGHQRHDVAAPGPDRRLAVARRRTHWALRAGRV